MGFVQHLIILSALLLIQTESFSFRPDPAPSAQLDRREALKATLGFASVLLSPLTSNAIDYSDDQQGIGVITDSSIGKAFRRSVVRGAQVADKLDEGWEKLSDGLRDKSKCDKNTGRRLYDNGVRKDGTPIGNPGLGALCSLATLVSATKEDYLQKAIQDTKDLVRPSFERSMIGSDEEKRKKSFNFEFYSVMRAITNVLGERRVSVRDFQLAWGRELVSMYAPSANRKDYSSPFPKIDEFEDYDYDKNKLLDALGAVTVTLDAFKSGGILGFVEISIPYDDYGSVVTVAVDDYVPITAEILLSEQKLLSQGPIQALVVYLLENASIAFAADTFYLDPSTTSQTAYNPTQLLLSLSNLRKM
ncbi:hypothetical protein QTG54_005796 [Skeletonema marinoi]|uniref:Uncharacterized protein n=1 Tax=Skeletonema marinoi TaxID=267567 RepID=A0AAD9DEV0_9STRA|nr:hypothetical protein QTG54_005796 [Skeletonema marinoi]